MDAPTTGQSGELEDYLGFMARSGASDLFLTVGAPPAAKIDGVVQLLDRPVLAPGSVRVLAYSVMSERQQREFEQRLECDLAIGREGVGRFRVNLYMQRGEVSVVVRFITSKIPTLATLGLPPVLEQLALLKRGLVLVVGATGCGKSTTLASLLDHRNRLATGHIITIEDPIEFLHRHQRSLIDQREVGIDTHSFEEALRHTLRQAPDVIMIGEIRDRLTMQHALSYAETGHLCLSTLHANNANQAIDRILNFFPEDARRQVLMDLSLNLRAVVAQRLMAGSSGRRAPAVEIMLQSAFVSDLILKGQLDQIKAAMAKSVDSGMQTFDQSIYQLYLSGAISLEQALENADARTDLALRIRLHGGSRPPGGALSPGPGNRP